MSGDVTQNSPASTAQHQSVQTPSLQSRPKGYTQVTSSMQHIGVIFAFYAPLQASGFEGGESESCESPKRCRKMRLWRVFGRRLAAHRAHAFRHPRNLAGRHVAVEHAAGGRTHQVRLRNPQRLKRGFFRTLLDCVLNSNKKTPGAPAQPSVALRAPLNLADHFACRFRICHDAVIGGLCADVNTKVKLQGCSRRFT